MQIVKKLSICVKILSHSTGNWLDWLKFPVVLDFLALTDFLYAFEGRFVYLGLWCLKSVMFRYKSLRKVIVFFV